MSNQTRSKAKTITLHAVGDVGPRRFEYGEPLDSLFAKVEHKIKEADISFCQLEKNLSTKKGNFQWRNHTTWYGQHHPENVKSLVLAGFNIVSHACNHCFDYGPEALLETIDVLRSSNLQVIGVGKDIVEARKPAIIGRKGIKVGFLAYNSVLPVEFEAREEKPGCVPIRVETYYASQDYQAGTPPKIITIPLEADVLAMEEDIRKLRNEVDIVVVSMHWGIHFVPGMLAMYQKTVGHRAIDAGADIILGHHAHILKGIEIYKGRVIFYCIGSFALETPHQLKPPPGVWVENTSKMYRDQGYGPRFQEEPGWERLRGPRDKRYAMIARCIISKKAVEKVSFFPVWCNQRAEPELLPQNDEKFQEILNYIDPWCKDLGTTLSVDGDEVIVYDSTKK